MSSGNYIKTDKYIVTIKNETKLFENSEMTLLLRNFNKLSPVGLELVKGRR